MVRSNHVATRFTKCWKTTWGGFRLTALEHDKGLVTEVWESEEPEYRPQGDETAARARALPKAKEKEKEETGKGLKVKKPAKK